MNASTLCSLATVSLGGLAHINHMYFAWSDSFEVFWASDPDSVHSRNLARRSSAAVTIYDSHQTWGRPDRGIQLFGTGGLAGGRVVRAAQLAYSKRFRSFEPAQSEFYPFYRFRPRAVKLFDERALGGGTLVSAKVTPDGLAWLKTEVWA
jgi:Pyridoxamine 5'-phosphate oxidase